MDSGFLFTSESVTEGHPDKIADQVSDAVVDAALGGDPFSRVACETMLTTGLIVVAGEITTMSTIDYAAVVISPATTISPVVSMVSHATRDMGSPASAASTTASDIWSAILSGWPSVTDSEVNRKPLSMVFS